MARSSFGVVSGESPTPLSRAVTWRTTFASGVLKLELDLPEAQAIPRAALHGDSVVIDLGQGVVGRIVQEQALPGGLQLDKLLERLLSNEPPWTIAPAPRGISSRGPSQETSVRLSVEPSAAAGNFSVHLPALSPCVTRWRNVMP